MLARYRVVVLVYVLAFAFAAFVANNSGSRIPTPPGEPWGHFGFGWSAFWSVGLILGTGVSALWLLLCWVFRRRGSFTYRVLR